MSCRRLCTFDFWLQCCWRPNTYVTAHDRSAYAAYRMHGYLVTMIIQLSLDSHELEVAGYLAVVMINVCHAQTSL
jgi:hypothetical protein